MASELRDRLREPPSTLLVITGPRQVGKTYLVRQVLAGTAVKFIATDAPYSDTVADVALAPSLSTDQPTPGAPPTTDWLVTQWSQARAKALALPPATSYTLAIDE